MMDWNRLLSRRRLGRPPLAQEGESRTDFQRDFDRIVFSSAFRRLQDKTQVFPLAQNDYVRTRLTHSLEASSVGRTLGTQVGDSIIKKYHLKNVSAHDVGAVVAAACLAHDIGNPPFGHAGEEAIRQWFTHSTTGQLILDRLPPAQVQDLCRFEGNAQGFRVITRLQNPDNHGGMQLTCATLGAFTKYPQASYLLDLPPTTRVFKKFGFFQHDAPLFAEVAEELGLPCVTSFAWRRHPLAYLVEAADDICYRIIDIEDAFRQGQLSYEQVYQLFLPLTNVERSHRKLQRIQRPKEKVEYLRATAIGRMIEQTHACFMAHEEALCEGEFRGELLDCIPDAEPLQALKTYAETYIYLSKPVVEVAAGGFEVLNRLLEAFISTVNDLADNETPSPKSRLLVYLIPEQFVGTKREPKIDLYQRVLRMTDFIAGMTDSYAVSLYKKITGISLPRG